MPLRSVHNRFGLLLLILLILMVTSFAAGCGTGASESDDLEQADDDDDDFIDDDDDDDIADDDDDTGETLEELFESMGVADYIGMQYTRAEQGPNGYTLYYYDTEDCRCTNGSETYIAVSPGTENKVLLYLEGGGAEWPGGGFAVNLAMFEDIGVKTRADNSPIKDWHFVYVPHCDNSIHSGDNALEYDGKMRYHWGVRHTSAAVTLMKELYPAPEKILVSGASAGGFGTYMAWAVMKSQYMETDTYIFNDSGVGFWNPEKPDTWEIIKSAWNLNFPEQCERCGGPVNTWLFDLYIQYDPQVRIGMFSSYNDEIISSWFLGMDALLFEQTLMEVTGQIKSENPDRYARYFIQGNTHTTYYGLLDEGPDYSVDGISIFQWLDMLINDTDQWDDILE